MKMLKRLLRHLCITPFSHKRHFSPAAMQRIKNAIAESEKKHGGEICFAVELSLPLQDILRAKTGVQRALEVFSQLRVWDTEHNNGVLIYLLLADHDFEILADRGLYQHIHPDVLRRISNDMEKMFRAGQFESGVLHGIAQLGQILCEHYAQPLNDKNELPDAPVIL